MIEQFLDLYHSCAEAIKQKSADIFNVGRQQAFEWLKNNPFPTKKSEQYLYCPLFEIDKIDWGYNAHRFNFGLKQADLFHCAMPGFKTELVYMAGDVWLNEKAQISLGGGAFACTMTYAAKEHKDIINQYFNKGFGDKKDAFIELNSFLAQEGLFVYVPQNCEVELPLQVVTMLRAGLDLNANVRNLIVLERGAKLSVVDCSHTTDEHSYFITSVSEIFVGDGAKLNYYQLESTTEKTAILRRLQVNQEADSEVNIATFGLHAGRTRNHIEVDMNKAGGSVNLNGMLLIDGEQQCENYTVISHHAPSCTSNELYKYILDDSAVGGFSGRVVVDHGAQKSVSYQTSRNISLSEKARVLGRPQLEIYADDVKCGHGATTGQLDSAALFYMQQRGIGYDQARMLLLQAFCQDVIEAVDIEPLAERLRMLVERRLKGEKMLCATCTKDKG